LRCAAMSCALRKAGIPMEAVAFCHPMIVGASSFNVYDETCYGRL
jgi:hypothetical protein